MGFCGHARDRRVSCDKAIDAHPFITEYSDVESYFLNAAHVAELNPQITVKRAQELIDAATAATREKSIKALINIRTEAAIRNRNGGKAHNAGDLAARAYKDYDAAPDTWRRGKLVLNELKSLLHHELKANPTLLKASSSLRGGKLEEIKNVIWPPVKTAAKKF